MTRTIIRNYQELSSYKTFKERYNYLKLSGKVGEETFGFDRWLNQVFYRSEEWKRLRDDVILRDMGCDLGLEEYPIAGRVIIHHMNPVYLEDIVNRSEFLLNPDYLVCVSHGTHNAIHYGDEKLLPKGLIERKPGDTKLW